MKKISSILVVDDNVSDHIIAEAAIMGYDKSIKVHKAYDGEEALNILDAHGAFDLILLDINMPGMDGIEFLKVYTSTGHAPSNVAILTSSNLNKDKERCLQYDFVKEYIVKPIEVEDLQRIENYL